VIVLVGNVGLLVLVLVLGSSVLDTYLPIINVNPNLNAIACSNVMIYRQSIFVCASRGNETAKINVKKNCKL